MKMTGKQEPFYQQQLDQLLIFDIHSTMMHAMRCEAMAQTYAECTSCATARRVETARAGRREFRHPSASHAVNGQERR